jgi:hypothetical protein
MAGHWKHEWIPLDYTAAKQKGHGRVPKGWQPGGRPTRAAEPPGHGSGWEPKPSQANLDIEMRGTGGTSMGAFHRVKDAARMRKDSAGTWHVHSSQTGEKLGEVRPSSNRPGWWAGHSVYEPTGERSLEYHGNDFMAAVHGVLGHPAYGYQNYRVKREVPTVPKPRGVRRDAGHEEFVERTRVLCRAAGIRL